MSRLAISTAFDPRRQSLRRWRYSMLRPMTVDHWSGSRCAFPSGVSSNRVSRKTRSR